MKESNESLILVKEALDKIRNRSLPNGGFALNRDAYRPDATAWAILALEAAGGDRGLTIPACQRLAQSQHSDGRITAIEGNRESYWPTALCIMAWRKIPGFEKEIKLAAEFLLSNSGIHQIDQKNAKTGHDISIRGWPWIENTHSWIESTALATLALRACGYGKHERVFEAVNMILDRQLPSGGWNYGNSSVFGKELLPIIVSTGHALCALAGQTAFEVVDLSVNYLKKQIKKIRTPLSLSWSIFGLTAWGSPPLEFRQWILESLYLQNKYGGYNTSLLSQLIVAYYAGGDFLSLFD